MLYPVFATSVVNTGGKFTAGVVDAVGNLPPVSLIPVVHLDLRVSPWILKKFEMTLILFSGDWGDMIHEKNLKRKISWHCPF